MAASFVERWWAGESERPFDVWFDDDRARFEVRVGDEVVHTGRALVDVLQWLMSSDAAASVESMRSVDVAELGSDLVIER